MTGVRRTQRGGVSSAKAPLRRGADDWLFAMRDGRRVITLIDQFDKVLALARIIHNSHGDKYTLYSLRHFYAVLSLRRGIGMFDVARNMGTSVQIIQNYYGKHATCPFRKFHPAWSRIVRQNHRIIESDVCNPALAWNARRRPFQVAVPA
jgi:integrase